MYLYSAPSVEPCWFVNSCRIRRVGDSRCWEGDGANCFSVANAYRKIQTSEMMATILNLKPALFKSFS